MHPAVSMKLFETMQDAINLGFRGYFREWFGPNLRGTPDLERIIPTGFNVVEHEINCWREINSGGLNKRVG